MAALSLNSRLRNLRVEESIRHASINELIHDVARSEGDNANLRSQLHGSDRDNSLPFALNTINGNSTHFLDGYVTEGADGGRRAASDLEVALRISLSGSDTTEHHLTSIVYVFVDIEMLSRAYVEAGVLTEPSTMREFFQGFNEAYPLINAANAGSHRGGADTKIKEMIKFFLHMEQCHHLVLAGSSSTDCVSFLRDYHTDVSLRQRLKLIEAAPLPRGLGSLISQLAVLRFPQIFRSGTLLDLGPASSGYPPWRRRNDPRSLQEAATNALSPTPTMARSGTHLSLYYNKSGQRLDAPVPAFDRAVVAELKSLKLCNRHYLTKCPYSGDECNSSHDFRQPTEQERLALRSLARSVACRKGASCDDRDCCASHHCKYGAGCTKGEDCQFPHISDKVVAEVR